MNKPPYTIPKEAFHTTEALHKAGFEAYLVGGCVRDLVMGREPNDWDVTTNATPEQIIALFEKTFYENDYGTVGVVYEHTDNENLKVIEVTPYRLEGTYSDKRRPDEVTFAKNLEDDLKRRDFTINAMAYDPHGEVLVDPYDGQGDIERRLIRAVGTAHERFNEDALRIMRAVRIATQVGFTIENETGEAITAHSENLKEIAIERIQAEFSRLIMTDNPMTGVIVLHKYGLLAHIAPDLERGLGVDQNGAHIYTVWEHNLRALQHGADRQWPLHIRLSALFHDVSKPETRRWSKEKNDWTFYGHDVVGARVAKKALERLKYSKDTIDRVEKLVRWHLFFSDIEQITLSAVRRLVRNVGPDNVWDLMKLRTCDRIGMGRPKEKPYRLRKYEAMIEEATRAPVSVGMLKIDGGRIIALSGEKPGPRLGWVLHALLEEVLDDPARNTPDYLEKHALELLKLSDDELRAKGEEGKQKKDAEEAKEIKEIRKKHSVK